MRHGKKFNHLGRKKAHRKALLSNMANSLIEHKRINTTVAKAKALRTYVEPIISRAKDDSTHSRRIVFRYLQNKESVTELFRTVGPKVMDRPGGYTRIIKTGYRKGDGADMCLIELVDFNELYTAGDKKKKKRSRRGGAKKVETAPVAEVKETVETTVADAPEAVADVVEDVKEEASEVVENVAEVAEEVKEEAAEVVEDVAETAEEVKEEAADDIAEATDENTEEGEGSDEEKKDDEA